jgi:hypothetical protein
MMRILQFLLILFLPLSLHSQVNQLFQFDNDFNSWGVENLGSANFWALGFNDNSISGYSPQISHYVGWGEIVGGYQSNSGPSGKLYKSFNVSGYGLLKLNFDWRCLGEDGKDYGEVVYSYDGQTWNVLKTNLHSNQPDDFFHDELSVPKCANTNTVYIGFQFFCDESFQFQPGFVVDNVSLTGSTCTLPTLNNLNLTTCYSNTNAIDLGFNTLPSGNTVRWYNSPSDCNLPFYTGNLLSVLPVEDKTYYVTRFNEQNQCESTRSSIILNVNPLPALNSLIEGTSFGADGSIQLTVNSITSNYFVNWEGPAGYVSTMEDISGLNAGVYNVTVTDMNSCSSYNNYTVEEGASIAIPVVITPNSDGFNDVLQIRGIEQWEDFEMYVFNSENSCVYSQLGKNNGGQYFPFNGNDAMGLLPKGDYVIRLESKSKGKKATGILTILY